MERLWIGVRFILLDSETTGLDPRKDRLITIGAVSRHRRRSAVGRSLRGAATRGYNSSAVTVHGVTREESQAGLEEPVALEQFLDYLKDGIIVGHHIKHDVDTFDAVRNATGDFRCRIAIWTRWRWRCCSKVMEHLQGRIRSAVFAG